MTTTTHIARVVAERDNRWLRFTYTVGAAAFLAGGVIGGLGGWNLHETSDIHANYIAGLPSCTNEEGNR